MTTSREPLGAIDKILLRGASQHKSMEELSRMTGGAVSPARAGQRVQEILGSRNWLTDLQKRQLALDDLLELKEYLRKKVIDEGWIKDGAGPLVRVMTNITKVVEAERLDVDKAMLQIQEAHGRIMLGAIGLAFERAMLELERRHVEIDKTELREVLIAALPSAVNEIESKMAITDD